MTKHRRHRTQRPERALQPRHQRLERLAQRQRHIRPSAVAQHPLEQQVPERLPSNRHSQRARVREVERRFPTRNRHLLEVHLALRAVLRPPLPDPPLQRPQLPRLEATRMPPAQLPEQRQNLQPSLRIRHQLRHDLRLPHVAERVLPRPPRPRPLRRRRQCTLRPAARRPLAHSGRRRGRPQRLPCHSLLVQSPNLRDAAPRSERRAPHFDAGDPGDPARHRAGRSPLSRASRAGIGQRADPRTAGR